jgi:TonB-linked SusC/RagA family outer membrane protein
MQVYGSCKGPAFAGTEPTLFLLKRENRKILLVMKITAIFLLAATLQVSAKGWGQERISLSLTNASLDQALNAIADQAQVTFLYRPEYVKGKKVSIEVKNASLVTVLDLCVKKLELAYDVVGKTVIIHPVKNDNTTTHIDETRINRLGDNFDLKGRIISKEGEPLISANVVNKRTGKGTTTDAYGNFVLSDVKMDDIIMISFTGYFSRLYKVTEFVNLTLIMEPAVNQLDQVIMLAYGQTTQRLNTGNISKLSAEEIARQPVSNVLAALEGRVPGLVVTQSKGLPGAGFKVQIRGQNSIAQGADPLFVIDGVPFAPNNSSLNTIGSAISSGGNNVGLSPFNLLDPGDIESIEVLKDADALAIYGSRGANGAILITTKKGKSGKTNINLNVYTGRSRITKSPKLLNTAQYVALRKEALNNDNLAVNFANAPDLVAWDTMRYTDFKKLLIGNDAQLTNAQLSVSGGSSNTQFLLGGGLINESTVFPNNFLDRKISFHNSITHSSGDQRLKLSFTSSFVADKNNISSSDMTNFAFTSMPNSPNIILPNGKLNWSENGYTFSNPFASAYKPYTATMNNLLSNLSVGYDIIKGLKLRSSFGYNQIQAKETLLVPAGSLNSAFPQKGAASFGDNQISSWIIEPQVEYLRKIGVGRLTVLLGGTWQEQKNNSSTISATGYTNDALLKSLSAAGAYTIGNTSSEYHYQAVFGRITYNLVDKYIINLSGRRDGSSRFGPGKQFGNFGAIGAAWIFSNENFLRKMSFISFGKLRGSYGITGNDQIGDYNFFDTWTNTTNSYIGTPGLYRTQLFNPDFAWEVNRKVELGIDLGFFKDRVLIGAVFFRNRSGNQLVPIPQPSTTGFSSIRFANLPAEVENRGAEITLLTKNFQQNKFSWSTNATITLFRNQLRSFPGLGTSSFATRLVEGQSLNLIKGLNYLGVDPNTGLFTFEDLNKDGKFNASDYVLGGDLDPKLYGGINNIIRYDKFELTVFFEGRQQKGNSYLSSIYSSTSPGSVLLNPPVDVLDHWRNVGEQASIQKVTATSSSEASTAKNNFVNSIGRITDASFIRCKTVSISCDLPKSLLNKVKIKSVSLYLKGQNLFTITHYKVTDPETQSLYSLPPLRTITAGILCNF